MKDIQKEITPISNDDLFIVLNHPDAKFDYPIHYHSDFELNLVLNTYELPYFKQTIIQYNKATLARCTKRDFLL